MISQENKLNIDQIINEVYGDFLSAPEDERAEFLAMQKSDLITLHHTLGRHIRNKYGIWSVNWEPEIVDGTDHSPNHPDNISFTVIEKVWERAHEEANT